MDKALFELALRSIQHIGIFTLDIKGTIKTCNMGAEQIFEYSSKEMIDKPLSFLFPLKGKGLHRDLEKTLKNGQYEHDTVITTKLNRKIAVHCILTALYSKDQQLQGFSKIVWQEEEPIKKRDEFLSLIGHEVKNPLTSIYSYVQLLEKKIKDIPDYDTTQLMSLTGKIISQINGVTRLINDILQSSRLNIGTLPFYDEDQIDLEQFVKDICDQVQATFPNHRIEVEGAASVVITADKTRFEEMLRNLLQNAEKYSPKSGLIRVKLQEKDDEFCITIIDYGIGMDKKEQERIFQRFYRTQSAKLLGQGLGLGLYLVREIVRHYKGRIQVVSEKGKGSEFSIILPTKELASRPN